MTIVPFDTLEFFETPGNNASAAVATASRGATEVSVIRQRQQPGGFNRPHTHDREEVLVLLEGTLEVTIDGTPHTLTGGDTVIIPARAEHQHRNAGDEPAEWLLVAPAGVKFFHASGEEATLPWEQ